MPELPEVHALVTDLRSRLGGRTVARLEVLSFAALKTYDPPVSAVSGVVSGVSRHGKFLDLAIGDIHLVMHLARAGWVRWRSGPPVRSRYLAARLVLDDETGLDVTEAGSKKSLAIYVVRSPLDVPGIARLGPDPFSLDLPAFGALLASLGRAQIKGVLRNQSVIAGIGNAYSDEILHAARMSPFAPASSVDAPRLFDAMVSTLRAAIDRSDGLAASELKHEKKSNLQVHGRTGLPCPVCGDTVRQVIYTDSTFQYCPTCQTGGKPLADRVLSRLLR